MVTQFLDFARHLRKRQSGRTDRPLAIVDQANARAFAGALGGWRRGVCVNTHPAAFERMLMNLIENAHRYGKPPVEPHGPPRRHGDRDRRTGRGRWVEKPEDVERLKEPFVRSDHARRARWVPGWASSRWWSVSRSARR